MPKDPTQSLFTAKFDLVSDLGPSGLAEDLQADIIALAEKMAAKQRRGGCKTLESYADSVGFLRALDFVLSYQERKRKEQNPPATPIEEED